MIDKTNELAVHLFPVELLSDPGSRGFSVELGERLIEGFVVCQQGDFFAYLNSCPHTGSPLDWVDHQFLDLEAKHIQCATHDARFDIVTGRCLVGPCVDQYLKPLPVTVRDGQLMLLTKSLQDNSA